VVLVVVVVILVVVLVVVVLVLEVLVLEVLGDSTLVDSDAELAASTVSAIDSSWVEQAVEAASINATNTPSAMRRRFATMRCCWEERLRVPSAAHE
jgi:hypothetical protein